jgi:hypothetical protein
MSNPVRILAAALGLGLGGLCGIVLVGELHERYSVLSGNTLLAGLTVIIGFAGPTILVGYLVLLAVTKIQEARDRKRRKERRALKYHSTKRKKR